MWNGRAMLQLDIWKSGVQLSEAQKMAKVLEFVNIKTKSDYVGLGLFFGLKNNKVRINFLSFGQGNLKARQELFCVLHYLLKHPLRQRYSEGSRKATG